MSTLMSSSSPSFQRGLSPEFLSGLEQLTTAPEGQWWRDVLARRDLVVAVRNEYLNVYYRGASVFLVQRQGSRFVPLTHAKYLARRQQGLVALQPDGRFGLEPTAALWPAYEGAQTLDEMVRAAADLAGPEKIGVHALVLASPHVVDVEVSLEGAGADAAETDTRTDGLTLAAEQEAGAGANSNTALPPSSGSLPRRQDRLDVAALEERDGAVRLTFFEAKHFANPELRAGPTRTPPVAEQIARYRQTLTHHAPAIAQSYRAVCQAIARIDAMRQQVQGTKGVSTLDPLIARVANESLLPEVDIQPRLVVFGFDQDQRDGEVWSRHRDRLTGEYAIRLQAIGNTGAKRSPAFR